MEDAAEGEGIATQLAIDEADEPRLKYSALSHDAPFPGAPLRLAVSDKVLALGTSTGAVLILDYNGNQVWIARGLRWRARPACWGPWGSPAATQRQGRMAHPTLEIPAAHPRPTAMQVHAFKEHHAAVTELSFDQTAEYLGSSSEDGTVVVSGGCVCAFMRVRGKEGRGGHRLRLGAVLLP